MGIFEVQYEQRWTGSREFDGDDGSTDLVAGKDAEDAIRKCRAKRMKTVLPGGDFDDGKERRCTGWRLLGVKRSARADY